MIRLRRVAALLLRQFYLMRGSTARLMPLFIWVAVDMLLWGYITKYLNTFTATGINFVPLLLGAVLLWDFLVRVMQGITIAFFEDVWSRNFLNFFAAPLSIAEYVAGLVLSSIVTSSIGLVLMLLITTSIFGFSFFAYGAALGPFLFVLFVFGIALGVMATALVLRFGPSSEWLVWPIPAILSPFAGVFYPVSTLPHWMQPLSYILPPSFIFEGMRAIVAGNKPAPGTLLLAALLSLLYLFLAYLIFRHVHKRAVKTGLIARYSAESLT